MRRFFFSNSNFLRKTRFDIFNFFNCSVRDCHSFDKRYFWRLLKSLSVARRRRRRCFLAKMTSPQFFSNLLTRSETRQKLFFFVFFGPMGPAKGKEKGVGNSYEKKKVWLRHSEMCVAANPPRPRHHFLPEDECILHREGGICKRWMGKWEWEKGVWEKERERERDVVLGEDCVYVWKIKVRAKPWYDTDLGTNRKN